MPYRWFCLVAWLFGCLILLPLLCPPPPNKKKVGPIVLDSAVGAEVDKLVASSSEEEVPAVFTGLVRRDIPGKPVRVRVEIGAEKVWQRMVSHHRVLGREEKQGVRGGVLYCIVLCCLFLFPFGFRWRCCRSCFVADKNGDDGGRCVAELSAKVGIELNICER